MTTIAVLPPSIFGQHACQDINRMNECIGIIEGTTGQELDPSVEPPAQTETETQPNTTQMPQTTQTPLTSTSPNNLTAIIVGGESETQRAADALLQMGFSVKLQPLSQIQPGIIQNQTQASPLEQLGETLGGIQTQNQTQAGPLEQLGKIFGGQ